MTDWHKHHDNPHDTNGPHNPAAEIAVCALTDFVRLIVGAAGLAATCYGGFAIHAGLGYIITGLIVARGALGAK